MNPYLSWAIVLLVAGGLGWYYKNASSPRARAPLVKPVIEKVESPVVNKKAKRKFRKSPDASSGSGTPTPVLKVETETRGRPETVKTAAKEEVDNKEFARQFSKVKEGTSLVAPQKGPSKKEQRAAVKHTPTSFEGSSGEVVSTRASSTTGADADDDLSPVESPLVNPITGVSGDISDMLEAPAPRASVLRVTGTANQQAPKKKSDSFKPVETKKQRQQKIKNENRKLMVEEAEKQRRALLEKQLHTARESERREAAKSKPAGPNPWAAKPAAAASGEAPKAPAPAASLLDTFEPVTKPEEQKPKASAPRPARIPSQGSWTDDLPSEEEQMRILGVSSDNEWTTVPSKKKEKKKGGNGNETVSDTSGSEAQPVKAVPEPEVPPPEPLSRFDPSTLKGHPLDSDWTA
ncbi:hypothetical protein AJ80_08351 [Polytolypa hystricis UAMH7299]|uniref:Uncharacterized protein n=1 Tax=Polytolypa hystricis (strain UAMH7299) TaxID=1447883 RepID=A0A2B7X9D7_POLH7|nr:hypothetical protein AJ80_08351 [Polytolypa hystricis UAMH7299]